jgi:hypothetical protein
MTFDGTVERWREPLAIAAPDIPTDFLLAWVQVESDGYASSTGDPGLVELGLFQVSAEEARQLRVSDADFQASHTDAALSISIGVKLVRSYMTRSSALLASVGATWSAPSSWQLVKAYHAASGVATDLMHAAVRQLGRAPATFDEMVAAGELGGAPWSHAFIERTMGNAWKVGAASVQPPPPRPAWLGAGALVALAAMTALLAMLAWG